MSNINVKYNGKYPCTCMGRLTITEDKNIIYDNDFCCTSTGGVWFDGEWCEHVDRGELVWNESEASQFSNEIQEAVRNKLSEYRVCCGGCV